MNRQLTNYDKRRSIKIGQLNLRNSKAAGDEARKLMADFEIDVLLVQEPFSVNGAVRCFGLSSSYLTVGNQADGERPMAAIVCDPEIDPLELMQFKTRHLTTVEINTPIGQIFLVSGYFQCRDPIGVYLDHLDFVLNTLRGKQVIIGVDANAKSHLWYSPDSDDKGDELEAFINTHNLVVLNRQDQPPTHEAGNNIDVTLATAGLARKIAAWTVHEQASISDHRLITFILETEGEEQVFSKTNKFNVRKLKPERFNEVLSRKLMREYGHVGAAVLNDAIERALEETCPKVVKAKKGVPWWNPSLTRQRAKVRRLRARMQRCGDPGRRRALQEDFRRLRNSYSEEIRQAKKQSWARFISENANEDPYGFAYKLGASRLRLKEVMTNLRLGDGSYTSTTQETLEQLLNTLMPLEQEGAQGNEPMQEVQYQAEQEEGFSMVELKNAIKKAKPRRAPGPDRIPIDAVKVMSEGNLVALLNVLNECWRMGCFPKVWKDASLVILRKAGDRDWALPGSYRPISLLPVLGKIYERLMHFRLMKDIEDRHLLSEAQFGFMPGKSTADAVKHVINSVQNNALKYSVGVFLDIKGAFNELWWPSILMKLRTLGVSKNMYEVIKSYLSERSASLIAGNCAESNKQGVSPGFCPGAPIVELGY